MVHFNIVLWDASWACVVGVLSATLTIEGACCD